MINDDELALIWFNYNEYNFTKVEAVLAKFDKISDIFDKNKVKNAVFYIKDNGELKRKLLEIDALKFRQEVEDDLYKNSLEAITYVSKGYPEKLKNIDIPPLVLYAKGDVSLLNKKSISIVGTRKTTDYGKIVCEKFVKELSQAGLVTVSGLAYGIDTIVAETTLKNGGKTIAVLAGGLDSIYPFQNKDLAKRIESNGLLISEYKIGEKPQNFHFIQRNRIVAALGLGTLIVEAGKNSGTMTTAKYAIDQGKELFVVPGNINSLQSEGCNNLIDEMPDTFTISPERILHKLKIKKKQKAETSVQVDIVESKILDALSSGELSFDDLAEKTGISPSELSSKLIKLEMFDIVKKGAGNIYYKV